jgi:type IV secretory pathway VirB10-like protein
LLEDYDNDNIPDKWEKKYGLDHRDRADAVLDFDRDGFKNIEEYEAKTDPTDTDSKPAEKATRVDNSWIYIVVVVIVIVVLLVLFMILRGRKKEKEALEEIDSLVYPEEEPKPTLTPPQQPKPGMPMPPQPSASGPGQSGSGMGSMPPLPPPPPGVSPVEFHMQYMKMVQQMQQQKAGQAPTQASTLQSGLTIPSQTQTKGLPQTTEGDFSLRPKLPPGKVSENSTSFGQGSENSPKNDMKCPNCGISVQSGWFLCPGCKSPLN